jgi:KRAB domain-containing zinc finger protein
MSFGKFAPLLEHTKQTHKDKYGRALKLLPCFHCKKQFLHRKSLLDHNCKPVADIIKKMQKKRKGAKLSNLDKYRFGYVEVDTTPQTCRQCDKVFENDDEFVCHQNSICLETPKFICTVCGKEFVSNKKLNSHKVIHNKRQFICDTCGIGFVSKVGLAAHTRSHTDGRNFKCDSCPAAFVDKGGLKSHMTIHQERKFECNLCAKRFRTYENIRVHMAIHSKDLLKFDCGICSKKFVGNYELKRHNRNFHSSEF